MISILTSLVLFIAALILVVFLFIPGILHAIYGAIRWGNTKRRISYYFRNSALTIDIAANTLFDQMLNDWFLRRSGYYFGKKGETISSALGKNQCINGLTWFGKGLASILDLLEKDHCWISIDEEIYHEIYEKPKRISRDTTFVCLILFTAILYGLYKLLVFII